MFTDSEMTLKTLESAKKAYLKFVKKRPILRKPTNWCLYKKIDFNCLIIISNLLLVIRCSIKISLH